MTPRRGAVFALLAAALSACGGVPGPGMALDFATRGYGNSKAGEYAATIERNFSARADTRDLDVRVVYSRGLETGFLPRYVILVFGRVDGQQVVDRLKVDIPAWIDVDPQYCTFNMANVRVGGV